MKRNSFIKCECGTLLQVVSDIKECCVQLPEGMELLTPRVEDATTEKHVPFIEEKENGYLVKVGKEAKHPMLDAHYIEFIELEIDGEFLYRKYLKAGAEPEAFFEVPKGKEVVAREYCNIHGLWASK
mgnify:FL=1|jgi:superoxide reductase